LQDSGSRHRAHLDAIAARVVDAADGDDVSPDVTSFLIGHYLASPTDAVGHALGVALARALYAADAATETGACAAWLHVLFDAAPIADDARVLTAAGLLADRLRTSWPGTVATAREFAACVSSTAACLRAAPLVDRRALAAAAVDELERLGGAAYTPGQALGVRLFHAPDEGVMNAHVSTALALLTAFEVTARLPYSMLAEELMQPVVREPPTDVGIASTAARVCCRLALLHDNEQYMAAAVVAPRADYRADAARLLQSHEAAAQTGQLWSAARYGMALREFMSVSSN